MEYRKQAEKRFKFLRLADNEIRSECGGEIWEVGLWKKAEGELGVCHNGFHCCAKPIDALVYVQGEILAEV